MTVSNPSKAWSRLAKGLTIATAIGAVSLFSAPAFADPVYDATFVHPPVNAPGREELRNFIRSLQRGMPDYKGMTPELASAVMSELPTLQQKARVWGALKSLDRFNRSRRFEPGFTFRTGDNGPPIYVATFEHGRVAFALNPLANGKLAAVAFQEVS